MKIASSTHPLIVLFFSILFVSACTTTSKKTAQPSDLFQGLLKQKNQQTSERKGEIIIHSLEISPLIQSQYSRGELEALETRLKETLSFKADSRGLVHASDRVEDGKEDPTHYDAIWVRDSLWIYLGLQTNRLESESAKKLLLTLTDYFSSPDQLKRFQSIIQNPSLLKGKDSQMNAVHIRFDARSPTFQDVQENGVPQKWNHKQNDALGLFLDLYARAILDQSLNQTELNPSRLQLLHLLPDYFAAIKFDRMEDAGSWEEIERVNTSSISLVTSGLERLQEVSARHPEFHLKNSQIKKLIDQGYATLLKQLKMGGESPAYPLSDVHYRTSDAALLNLIYPAQLSRLQASDYELVLKTLQPLIGEIGMKRYLKDSYQSGNFWFNQWPGVTGAESKTDDTSSAGSFAERGSQFIPDSEAQWFFDSWYSIALGTLAKRYPASPSSKRYESAQVLALNRALGQITGGSAQHPPLAADGMPVLPLSLPESYNTVVDLKSGRRYFAPSPITPLNWAKASLRIAFSKLKSE